MTISVNRKQLFLTHSKTYKKSSSNYQNIFFNILGFLIVIGALTLISWGSEEMTLPLSKLNNDPIKLDLISLVQYALRTTLRMFIAIVFSLIMTLFIATLAAKNSYVEQILIPVLDILQSVPILGYISFTFAAFLALFPGSQMGAEMAAIFAIFTSQVWNMIFSFYQSLKTLPAELNDTAKVFEMDWWRKFWQIEVPFAIPSLAWNIVMSMSSGWFYVVASEVIVIGSNKITLPGIGSYIALAILEENTIAIVSAIIAMTIVILLYDQIILRPMIVWADKFRYEMSSSAELPSSWVYTIFTRSLYIKKLFWPLKLVTKFVLYQPCKIFKYFEKPTQNIQYKTTNLKKSNYIWRSFLVMAMLLIVYHIFCFIHYTIGEIEVLNVLKLSCYTMLRVTTLIIIASCLWLPAGIYIGLNPSLAKIIQPLSQFFASFPANLFFPMSVLLITHYNLNPDIWLSPLMIIGSQWYILFNVIAGTLSIPGDLKEVIKNLDIKGWLLCRKIIIPAVTPYFITGAITACGATWNASIVAEFVNYGNNTIVAQGLGSYIAEMAMKAEFNRVALGVCMMAFFVVTVNRFFWLPINDYVVKKFQL